MMERWRAGRWSLSSTVFEDAVPSSGRIFLSERCNRSKDRASVLHRDVYGVRGGEEGAEFLGIWGLKVKEKEFGGILFSP